MVLPGKMIWQCVFLFVIPLIAEVKSEQPNGNDTNTKEIDPFEESIVKSMLRIVDEKFDSLSNRMGSVERSLTVLQYYNLRQFRVVNTHLHALDTLLQAIHSQIGQQDIGTKEMATSISLLKREIKNMEMQNDGAFGNIEKNFVILSTDLTHKIDNLQSKVLSSVNESKDADTNSKLVAGIMAKEISRAQNICIEAMSRTEDKIDDLTNITVYKLDKINEDMAKESENETEVRHLMTRLSEVNDNVLESISFYRHTGDLVERIVGATESVAEDRDQIRDDIKHFLELQTNNSMKSDTTNDNEIKNDITNEINGNDPDVEASFKCDIAALVLEDAMQVIKNGSRMIEFSTERAQINQNSLQNIQMQMSQEISNLKESLSVLENRSKSQPSSSGELLTGLMEFNIEELSNTTKGIFHITEAIASYTGWIPYIFTNLQFVESQVNETLKIGKELYKQGLQKGLLPKPTKIPKSKLSNIVMDQAIKPNFHKNNKSDENKRKSTLDTVLTDLMEDKNTTDLIEKFNSVVQTNQKLQRLIPALTRLLGEPEPFITITDGKTENEGRVEIYKMGRWGTLCDPLTHVKAAYICRHLGFLGGVAATPGYFGPGSGTFWKLNYTCLYSRQCDIALSVSDESGCVHENDHGVICDHMIRLTYEPLNDEPPKRNEGFLEMYDREKWRPVCSDNWEPDNTVVVCRQMGFENGEVVTNTTHAEEYETGTDSIITGTICAGNEYRLDSCSGRKLSRTACISKKPIYIICK